MTYETNRIQELEEINYGLRAKNKAYVSIIRKFQKYIKCYSVIATCEPILSPLEKPKTLFQVVLPEQKLSLEYDELLLLDDLIKKEV